MLIVDTGQRDRREIGKSNKFAWRDTIGYKDKRKSGGSDDLGCPPVNTEKIPSKISDMINLVI